MKNPFLFNTDVAIWVPFFRAYPNKNLTYVDGAVYDDGECRAVFPSQREAMAAMTEARRQAEESK